ncbi:LamB/YcsF family protein [Paenibacillus thermoaerophilus]|uniref:5-oxoprolinase subunit A n=1 Tax=Paenibacillus thermoaerophilus TaxID=1215385 RepID=A0ABW2UWN6_9BACL|nr:5-oxoprolinase subunit PxpA [Paenibacillus thermoaerophilus]TMV15919.1 LamB/YcsF family protein [Paenibacillus thermoaerophilus]
MKTIDLNCDMGESYGVYRLELPDEALELISSANIACGYHAGDPATMRRTVKRCLERGIAVGAHPGLPDLAGFGRRRMDVSPDEAYELTLYQIGALDAFVRAEGGRLSHVKPHGALYNMAADDARLAEAIATAVARYDDSLVLFGLSGSELTAAARRAGLRAAEEAFADRAYMRSGRLVPRSMPGSVHEDTRAVAEQALALARNGAVRAWDAPETVAVRADTLCLHGDGPHAAEHIRAVRLALEQAGFSIRAPGR